MEVSWFPYYAVLIGTDAAAPVPAASKPHGLAAAVAAAALVVT